MIRARATNEVAARRASGLEARQRGMTLIELIVVVSILSISLTVVGLRLDGVTANSRLKASARQIGSTVEFLQNQAVVNGRFYFLQIDLDQSRYRTVIAPEHAREGMDLEGLTRHLSWNSLERGVVMEDLTFDDGVTLDRDLIDVPFGPTGMTWGFMIHLINDDNRRYTVEANSITGLVQFHPYYKEMEEIPEELFR